MNNPIQKKYCFRYAKKTVKKLRKQLQRISCATEFVILTNKIAPLNYPLVSKYILYFSLLIVIIISRVLPKR